MNITKSGRRGCGDRKVGGAYLCLGSSPFGTLTIEDLIRDPAIPWDKDWMSRAATVLPRDKDNPKESVHDVYMVVDSAAYPFPWPFLEEARVQGFSKRIQDSFSFDKLTVGYSKVRLIFPRGIPKFEYDIAVSTHIDHHPSCKAYDILREAYPHIEQFYGAHSTGSDADSKLRQEMEDYQLGATFCTYAHSDIDAMACDFFEVQNTTEATEIQAVFPSIADALVSWKAYQASFDSGDIGTIQFLTDKENWIPAICAEFVLSHVEIHKVDNPKIRQKANRAGYSVFVTGDEDVEEII